MLDGALVWTLEESSVGTGILFFDGVSVWNLEQDGVGFTALEADEFDCEGSVPGIVVHPANC